MSIDYSKIKRLTAREIVKALEKEGFERQRRRKGSSHRRYVHPDGRRVTVAYHKGSATFPFKTLKSMIEDHARWTEEDLKRLRLLK